MTIISSKIEATHISVIDSEVTLSHNSIVHLKDVRDGDLVRLVDSMDSFIVNYICIGYNNDSSLVYSTDGSSYSLNEPYVVMVTPDYTRCNREFFEIIDR